MIIFGDLTSQFFHRCLNKCGTDFYYRKLGENNSGVPIIFLNHLAATMDNCDPAIMDGIASKHPIVCFDNRGVGATKGKTPKTIAEMAKDARSFIHALGYEKVDLIGFSLGGFISQEILLQEPQLIRKAIITGTGLFGILLHLFAKIAQLFAKPAQLKIR